MRIGRGICAHFLGKGGIAVLGFIFAPLFVRLLGIESYGLIGFYSAISSILLLFDCGMGDSLSRELARSSTQEEWATAVRTLELFYWVLGVLIISMFLILAPLVGHHWLHASVAFSGERLTKLILLMGIAFFFQWPFIFYCKGLLGLEHHFSHNFLMLTAQLLRFGGGASIIFFYPSIETFFYWQIFVSLSQTLLALTFLWHHVGAFKTRPRFCKDLFSKVWRFSLGMTFVNMTGGFLIQADRIVLGKLFSLEQIGQYSLACALASALHYLLTPFLSVFYPLFVKSVEKQEQAQLTDLYHTGCQYAMCALTPAAALIITFPEPILALWTQNPTTAAACAPLARIITTGILFNCCLQMPYYLQLAHGWTRLTLFQNLIAVLLIFPVLAFTSHFYGLSGIAFGYFLLNFSCLILTIPRMHKRILPTERNRWYLSSVLLPIIIAFLTPLLPLRPTAWLHFIALYSCLATTLILVLPLPRKRLLHRLQALRTT